MAILAYYSFQNRFSSKVVLDIKPSYFLTSWTEWVWNLIDKVRREIIGIMARIGEGERPPPPKKGEWLWLLSDTSLDAEEAEKWELLKKFGKNQVK